MAKYTKFEQMSRVGSRDPPRVTTGYHGLPRSLSFNHYLNFPASANVLLLSTFRFSNHYTVYLMIFCQTYLVFFFHLLTQKWSSMKTRRSRYSLRANLYVGSHLNMETNRAARISSSPLFLLAWFFKSQNQFYLFYMVYLVCTYVYTHIMYLQPSLRALAIRWVPLIWVVERLSGEIHSPLILMFALSNH